MAARNFPIRSPREEESNAAVREAVLLGAQNAAISGTVVAVPTLVACRVVPWAKHNLNYTAQALIISAGTMVNDLSKAGCLLNHDGFSCAGQHVSLASSSPLIKPFYETLDRTPSGRWTSRLDPELYR